jgi:hypothetical protein
MLKDFDTWNSRKKTIDLSAINPPYLERDIWWCSLGVNIGFEENGDNENSERPVIIFRGFSKELCWIIPLTTSIRLINRISLLDWDNFMKIEKAIRKLI